MNSWIDLAVIAAYLVGTTLFGCSFYFRKGAGDAKTFMAGGMLGLFLLGGFAHRTNGICPLHQG